MPVFISAMAARGLKRRQRFSTQTEKDSGGGGATALKGKHRTQTPALTQRLSTLDNLAALQITDYATVPNRVSVLATTWQESVQCESPTKRERVCQQLFVGGQEEYELLEALKFLMLKTVIQLHSDMQNGSCVPEFCWLLFARDTSKCPRSFFTNHLKHVGFSGGLEQVEMFLLGYSLQHRLRVFRLYKADTEEFITYYPNDQTEWLCLSLVTEDDRHYNVPVPNQSELDSKKHDKPIRPKWNKPSSGTGKTTVL
ncbi:Ubiquitin thioesterase otulin [Bagarius yarrelli]|uniref:Ubiquitin thioesterase otulin n=1 Tax=Bagarius yarrelli TaxID=175774 RepID=A0A556TV88_BAGYA|nr:Ubiquitin thioesterase otulin [Bagarius yarrelli]